MEHLLLLVEHEVISFYPRISNFSMPDQPDLATMVIHKSEDDKHLNLKQFGIKLSLHSPAGLFRFLLAQLPAHISIHSGQSRNLNFGMYQIITD